MSDFYDENSGGGYNYTAWKSNRAVSAEREDKYPATELAKRLEVSAAAIKTVLVPCEWHHTSSFYNKTDYYDGSLLIAVAAGATADSLNITEDEHAETVEQLAELRLVTRELGKARRTETETVHEDCYVEWLHWFGTRNYPKSLKRKLCNVKVSVKGGWATIHDPYKPFRKNLSTRGFSFRPMAEQRAIEAENCRIAEIRTRQEQIAKQTYPTLFNRKSGLNIDLARLREHLTSHLGYRKYRGEDNPSNLNISDRWHSDEGYELMEHVATRALKYLFGPSTEGDNRQNWINDRLALWKRPLKSKN